MVNIVEESLPPSLPPSLPTPPLTACVQGQVPQGRAGGVCGGEEAAARVEVVRGPQQEDTRAEEDRAGGDDKREEGQGRTGTERLSLERKNKGVLAWHREQARGGTAHGTLGP